MPSPQQSCNPHSVPTVLGVKEDQVVYGFIGKLQALARSVAVA